ncbi:MAG: hypothetical protein IMZ58_09605 [Thermoplasmata archaeon]|nr:hypothetical protein [Thermoplasmata archaeon]
MGLHQGCTSSLGKIYTLLFVAYVLFSILCLTTVISESTASLAISVSVVEGDTFRPGQSFHIITEIRNSKSSGRVDVKVTYEVTDVKDNSILVESTTVAIETLSSFSEEIKLPETIKGGVYLLKANVTSLDGTKYAEVSRSLSVVEVSENQQLLIEYIMGGALIITAGGLFYEHKRISKLKVSEDDLKKFIELQK